ncbi:MAG: hypothetical protein ACRDHP_19075, partial [Ktedonobacterales bacterium]
EYYKHGYMNLVGFASIGSRYGERIGITQGAIGPTGYDGQFAYYLALRPDLITSCAHDIATCPLDNLREMRAERILYPITARLLAFGQSSLLPLMLLLLNFVAILVTAALLGQLCVEQVASRWLGTAAGLFTGEALAFTRDLNDPYALMWLVLAVYLARKERWRWSAVAIAAALLTREQLVLLIPFIALPLLAQRSWRTLVWFGAIALAPFLAWQIALRVLYGAWALLNGDSHIAGLAPIPFGGFWQTRGSGDFKLIAATVALPLVIALVIAALALRRNGIRSLLRDPLPAMVIAYCLLASLLSPLQWVDVYGPGRLAAPGIVLAVLVSISVARPLRAAYALLLAGPTVLALFTNINFLLGAHPHFT